MFAEGGKGIIGAIILIAGGLICVPKTRRIIEQKYNFQFSKPAKYIAVIFAWFSIGVFSKPTSQNTTKENTANSFYSTPTTKNETPLSTDTVTEANVPVTRNQTTEVKSEEVKKQSSKIQSNKSSVSSQNLTTKSTSSVSKKSKKKKSGYGNSYTSGRSGYIRGPRGGCYYINSNGRKVYVDHSYCN